MSHFGVMVVFALFVSIVFAALMRDEPRDQLRLGRGCSPGSSAGLLVGWLLYPFPL